PELAALRGGPAGDDGRPSGPVRPHEPGAVAGAVRDGPAAHLGLAPAHAARAAVRRPRPPDAEPGPDARGGQGRPRRAVHGAAGERARRPPDGERLGAAARELA